MTGNILFWIVFAAIAVGALRELLAFFRWSRELKKRREERLGWMTEYRAAAFSTNSVPTEGSGNLR